MSWQMQWLPMMPAIFRGTGISHLAQSMISQVPVRSWARSISLSSRWARWGFARISCQRVSNSGLGRSVFRVGARVCGVLLMMIRLPSWNQWVR